MQHEKVLDGDEKDQREEARRERLQGQIEAVGRLHPVGIGDQREERHEAAPAATRLRPAGSDEISSPMGESTERLQPLNFHERQRLPTISPGALAGSSGFERNQIERIEDQKANPWGSEENHPGRL